jgi:predicted  nucleic acid-binding Zn-ribbon protein
MSQERQNEIAAALTAKLVVAHQEKIEELQDQLIARNSELIEARCRIEDLEQELKAHWQEGHKEVQLRDKRIAELEEFIRETPMIYNLIEAQRLLAKGKE